jgi:hypothetical protein
MSAAAMTELITKSAIAGASANSRARLAGLLWIVGLIIAITGEAALHGNLALAAGYVAVLLYIAMTWLIYQLFRPVNHRISTLAAFFNLLGLGFETVRWNPMGIDIALPFTGCFCLLLACMVFKSNFLPRIFVLLVGVSGAAWITFLSPSFAERLAPYNVAAGILGTGSLMMWLLVKGLENTPQT